MNTAGVISPSRAQVTPAENVGWRISLTIRSIVDRAWMWTLEGSRRQIVAASGSLGFRSQRRGRFLETGSGRLKKQMARCDQLDVFLNLSWGNAEGVPSNGDAW